MHACLTSHRTLPSCLLHVAAPRAAPSGATPAAAALRRALTPSHNCGSHTLHQSSGFSKQQTSNPGHAARSARRAAAPCYQHMCLRMTAGWLCVRSFTLAPLQTRVTTRGIRGRRCMPHTRGSPYRHRRSSLCPAPAGSAERGGMRRSAAKGCRFAPAHNQALQTRQARRRQRLLHHVIEGSFSIQSEQLRPLYCKQLVVVGQALGGAEVAQGGGQRGVQRCTDVGVVFPIAKIAKTVQA